MKRCLQGALFLSLIICGSFHVLASGNLLTNPDFSEWDDNTNMPVGWVIWVGGDNKAAPDYEIFNSPPASLEMTRKAGANRYSAVGQQVPVIAGATYKLSAWVKQDKIKPKMFMWVYDKNGRHFATSQQLEISTPDGQFKKYEIIYEMPKDAAAARVQIELYNPDQEGIFWVDDVELSIIIPPPSQNLRAVPTGEGKVMLLWDEFADPSLTYNIYRFTFNGFTPRPEYLIATNARSGYVDSDVNYAFPTESLFYRLVTVGGGGEQSKAAQAILLGENDNTIGNNLVLNGDFSLLTPDFHVPQGFDSFQPSPSAGNHLILDNETFRSQPYSAKMVKNSAGSIGTTSNRFSLERGRYYRISAKVKSENVTGGVNAKLYAYVHDQNGTYLGNTPIIDIPRDTNQEWIDVSVEFLAQANWKLLDFRWEIWDSSTRGTVWLDNLCFAEIDLTPPNQVKNLVANRLEDGKVKLLWGEPDVAADGETTSYYRIERSGDPKMQDSEIIFERYLGNSFTDNYVAYNYQGNTRKDYHYRVIAFDRINQPSDNNPIIIAPVKDDTVPPNSPKNYNITRRANGAVELSWDVPKPASDGDLPVAYGIYREEVEGFLPSEENLVVITQSCFYLDDEVTYENDLNTKYYKLIAFDNVYNPSVPSLPLEAIGGSEVIGRVLYLKGGTPVEGAIITSTLNEFEKSTDEQGYFRLLIVPGSYELLFKLPLYYTMRKELTVSAGETIELDEPILLERDETPPCPPVSLEVSDNKPGMLVLIWNTPEAAKDGGLPFRYHIYRGSYEDFIANEDSFRDVVQTTYWEDLEVVPGEKYYYKLKSEDEAENFSAPTNAVWGIATPSLVPKSMSPSNKTPIKAGVVRFGWDALAGVEKYLVELSRDEQFTEFDSYEVDENELEVRIVSKSTNEGIWYWRLKVLYENSLVSDYTSVQEFVVIGSRSSLAIPYVAIVPQVVYPERNQELAVRFILSKDAMVSVEVYNAKGMKVISFGEELKEAGEQEIIISSDQLKALKSGLYFVTIKGRDSNLSISTLNRFLLFF